VSATTSGTFLLRFTNPTDFKRFNSAALKHSMSASQLRDGINEYFKDQRGVNTVVTKKTYKADDTETTVDAEIVKIVFEIKLDRMVSQPSTSAMTLSSSV